MTQADIRIRATALARDVDLSEEGRALLRADQSPGQFLGVLSAHHLYADAIQWLSRWLPIREAIWWGCQCLWHVHRSVLPRAEEDALRAAVRWVVDPTERNRRAAQEAGDAGGGTPAGCLALAAFWSGGSISLPDLPSVEPPAGAAANILARGLILLSADLPQPELHLHRFLQLGSQIAAGGNHWDTHLNHPAASTRDEKEKR